jgi:hypothetical protein
MASRRHESTAFLHPLLSVLILKILFIFINIASFIDNLLIKLIFGCNNCDILEDLLFERFGKLPVQFLKGWIVKRWLSSIEFWYLGVDWAMSCVYFLSCSWNL